MKPAPKHLLAAALLGVGGVAQAADHTFSGHIEYHSDIVRIGFSLNADATDVKLWTDSFKSGLNFDPMMAVWALPVGAKLGENDDASVAPGQTYFDAGLAFASLAAGNYLLTVSTYPNWAVSDHLADGFSFDGETPIAIADWCQPSSGSCTDQKGTFWRVHLTGVDVAAPIPEPQSYALMAIGLLLVAAARRHGGR